MPITPPSRVIVYSTCGHTLPPSTNSLLSVCGDIARFAKFHYAGSTQNASKYSHPALLAHLDCPHSKSNIHICSVCPACDIRETTTVTIPLCQQLMYNTGHKHEGKTLGHGLSDHTCTTERIQRNRHLLSLFGICSYLVGHGIGTRDPHAK